MKVFFAFLLGFSFTNCLAQQNKYKCPCSTIGLDTFWADSSTISCYLIPVPKDMANPAKGTFRLAVAVAPALHESKENPLLYLHGGPGIATVENVPRYLRSKTWKLLREKRSLIFFDYRGTGFSEPKLCEDMKDSVDRFAKADPSAEAKQSYQVSLYKKCRELLLKEGTAVSSFNSAQLAEDANTIRQTLSISKWSMYGVSFGTTVALNFLRMHDRFVESAILDSPFPPNAPWLDFVRPFDTAFKILEKNIAADPVAHLYFPAIRTDFTNAVKRMNKTPVRITDKNNPDGYDYSGDDFAWSIWSAMLNPRSIPFVPLAIHEAGIGNDSFLARWVTAFSDPNAHGMFSEHQSKAILCYEARPRSVEETKSSLLANYPDFSSFYVDFEGSICDAWQPESAAKKAFEPVVSNVPVLVLSGEYDPVCPPLFGSLTSQTLINATFITVPAASHAAIHADDCIRGIADTFLTDPTLKINIDCVIKRPKIVFLTRNLNEALAEFK